MEISVLTEIEIFPLWRLYKILQRYSTLLFLLTGEYTVSPVPSLPSTSNAATAEEMIFYTFIPGSSFNQCSMITASGLYSSGVSRSSLRAADLGRFFLKILQTFLLDAQSLRTNIFLSIR